MRLSVLFPFPSPDQHHQLSIIDIQRRSPPFTGTRSFARTVSLTPKSFLHGTLSRRICPRFLPRNYAPFLAIIPQAGRRESSITRRQRVETAILAFVERASLARKTGLILASCVSRRELISRGTF